MFCNKIAKEFITKASNQYSISNLNVVSLQITFKLLYNIIKICFENMKNKKMFLEFVSKKYTDQIKKSDNKKYNFLNLIIIDFYLQNLKSD